MPDTDTIIETSEARVAELPESLSDAYRKKMGELRDLTDEQKTSLKKWLKEKLNDWVKDTQELHERLEDDNDLVEGIIMETDFPWVDASNVHEPLTEIYMDGARSIEKRSILGAGILWVAETDDDALMQLTTKVEEYMNYSARNKWNIERMVPGVIWTANRDGLGIVQCPYVEEYEKVHDILVIGSEAEFMKEFPSPEEAGWDEGEYNSALEMARTATDQQPIEIPFVCERQIYAGPKVEIVDLVDFVTIPAWVPHIKDPRCRGYGKRYTAHIETIREKGDDGVFYDDAAKKVIEKGKKAKVNSYTQAKDDIIGIRRTNSKDERTLFELVVKGRLEDDGDIEKLIVTYDLENDELLQATDYVYRVDFYALFITDERPNQLVGKSIPSKTRDQNDLADTLVNQTVNANTIGTVPIFKGKKDMKEELDPEVQQNKIRPGMILWLADFDSFAQFPVQPTDHGENIQLAERAMRVMDMYIGMPASLFAGGTPSGDPNAPGNKTAALIGQGNLRMEDPISFLRYGMADLGDICLSHVYQFGPPELSYQSEQMGNNGLPVRQTNTIYKKYLRKGFRMKMAGVNVIDNPDTEMAKQFQLHTILMTNAQYAQRPDLQNEVLRDALQRGRVRGRDRYLPTSQQLQAQMVQLQKMAMEKMAAEKMAVLKKAKDVEVEANLKKARRELGIKDVATRIAKSKLGINGVKKT